MNVREGATSDERRRIAVTSPLDVCAFVDELDAEAVGEIFLADGERGLGTVFVEHGKICWAAARGMARRFTELLVANTGASSEVVQRVIMDCIVERAPLGERLLQAQVVDAQQLRSTILQHTAESLSAACADPSSGIWSPRRLRGYASRFAFDTEEVLAEVVRRCSPTEGARRNVDGRL